MTADSMDGFEYKPASEFESEAMRRHYWAVAIGLQAVDGLSVSSYLKQRAQEYIHGERNLSETGSLIRAYHRNSNPVAEDWIKETEEADLVSQRIVELLSDSPFFLGPDFLPYIHGYLFQDLNGDIYHPGEFKSERLAKQEDILNGDSVLYADPSTYKVSLHAAFEREAEREYTILSEDELQQFTQTLAFLWQIHPFYEGNTRTIAVFSELYLRSLGFGIADEPFQQNSKFYRDALVRAVYRNPDAGIFPDRSFLVAFYENLIGCKQNVLDRKELLCLALFEDPSLLRNIDPSEALFKGDSQDGIS